MSYSTDENKNTNTQKTTDVKTTDVKPTNMELKYNKTAEKQPTNKEMLQFIRRKTDFDILETVKDIQATRTFVTASELRIKHKEFATTYPELFSKAVREKMSEKDMGQLIRMLAILERTKSGELGIKQAGMIASIDAGNTFQPNAIKKEYRS
jgi:hypothetical protein